MGYGKAERRGGLEVDGHLKFAVSGINVHGYFLEYDTEHASGFEPLRHIPKGL
jgi:5-methyltetrahydropteroyltriglutamate--homocysteine methyltransferase